MNLIAALLAKAGAATVTTKVLVAVPAQGATPQTNWTLKMIQGFGPARVAKCDAGN